MNTREIEEFTLRTFNKDFTPKTLIDRTYFYEFNDIDNQKLVSIFHYSIFVKTLLKWPSLRSRAWKTNETITLGFLGGEDHIQIIKEELQKRGILNQADNSYHIDFMALRRINTSNVVKELEKINGCRF